MDILINNPGLKHLAEKIFLNLEFKNLEMCARVNESWRSILKDPLFWIHKYRQTETFKNMG